MRQLGPSIVIALTCLLVGSSPARADQAAFQKAVATIRAYFEKHKDFPNDPALYAETIHVGHNYDPVAVHEVNSKVYLDAVAKAHANDKPPADIKQEITRFLVADNTVVVTLLSTGTRPSGDPLRVYITYFIKLGADGRIIEKETWLDRAAIGLGAATARPAAPASPR